MNTLKPLVKKLIHGYRITNGYASPNYSGQAQLEQLSSPQEKVSQIPANVQTVPYFQQPNIAPIIVPIKIQTVGVPEYVVHVPDEHMDDFEDQRDVFESGFASQTRKRNIEREGFEIPKISGLMPEMVREETEKKPSLAYSLIPSKPSKDEPVFAYAKINWNETDNKYTYEIHEPEMTPNLSKMFGKIKQLLEEKLDIDFSKLKKFESKEYLHKNIDEVTSYFGIGLSAEEKKILHYYIERDFIGLGKIEPFMRDPDIEDISCDGIGIPIFIFHRNPMLNSVETNVSFDDQEELDSFVLRLSQLTGKSISVAQPLIEGALPDGSRLQATLATDIARRGSNFTIRKFTEEPLTPSHLIKYNSIDPTAMAFLWMAVDYGRSVLVSGGTASGKTSMLNALSLFIKPEKKIISIEDTPELKLPHPHWVPSVSRTSVSGGEGKKIGEVDMFDLLRESLRQRPDYLILGEVRGKETYVLFQEMATGHPSLATIHAESMAKLVDRLTTPPINLAPGLIGNLDVVVFMLNMKRKDKFVRRVTEVMEVVGVNPNTKNPITNVLFKWDPVKDTFEINSKSYIMKKISMNTGLSHKELTDEFARRIYILTWMAENNIMTIKDIYNVLHMYYSYPERVIASIRGGMQ